jgi:hypothetical protein
MVNFFILLFAAFSFFTFPAAAQEDSTDSNIAEPVNDEQEEESLGDHTTNHHKNKDTARIRGKFKYRIALEGVTTRGNVNRSLITIRNAVSYEVGKFTFSMNTYAATGSQSKHLAEEEVLNNLTIHHYLTKKLYILGINTLEHSHLRGINIRWQGGGGFGLSIWKSDTNSLSISNAFLYESTDFRKIDDIRIVRNSSRVKGQHSLIHRHLLLIHETFFQPAVSDLSNITFRTSITISLPITKFASLRLSCNDSYETFIQPGKKHNDLQVTFGFSIAN